MPAVHKSAGGFNRESQGWEEAYDVCPGAAREEMFLKEQSVPESGVLRLDLKAYHETASAVFFEGMVRMSSGVECHAQVFTCPGGIFHQVPVFHDVKDSQGGSACQVVASECGSQQSVGGLYLGGDYYPSDGKAVGHAFRGSDDVSPDARELVGEEFPCPSVSGLYFIQNQDSAVLVTEVAEFSEKSVIGHVYSGYSLDALDDDSGVGAGGKLPFRRFCVVEGNESHITGGVEGRPQCRIVRSGDGSGCPAVEGFAECQDTASAGME